MWSPVSSNIHCAITVDPMSPVTFTARYNIWSPVCSNIHCARCNEDHRRLVPWSVTINCSTSLDGYQSTAEFLRTARWDRTDWHWSVTGIGTETGAGAGLDSDWTESRLGMELDVFVFTCGWIRTTAGLWIGMWLKFAFGLNCSCIWFETFGCGYGIGNKGLWLNRWVVCWNFKQDFNELSSKIFHVAI